MPESNPDTQATQAQVERPAFDQRRYPYPKPSRLAQQPLRLPRSRRWNRTTFASSYEYDLDRVNVLGNDTLGHTGCVNAVSWAEDGRLLLTGGDDTTVRLWRIDQGNSSTPFPFVCNAVLHTGHSGNIFNVQMLPYSSRIATVAGDNQVRVFDVESAVGSRFQGAGEEMHLRNSCLRVLRCHTSRTKRLVTEESSDLFLTVAEDGSVRQHDLRVPHRCPSGCPPPLVKLNHDLSTLALSPLTPYQFVVAGESPYGYLFDRRQVGRCIEEEWGMPANERELTTCVRRFGRRQRGPGEHVGCEHVTGARMSSSNGHEVLLSYSSDAVYLYSTRDDPVDPAELRKAEHNVLPPKKPRRKLVVTHETNEDLMEMDTIVDLDPNPDDSDNDSNAGSSSDGDHHDAEEPEDESEENEEEGHEDFGNVPVIMPRRRFLGACNSETVKDVNFLGPDDEFVVSGSDDGNFFMWRKSTGDLRGLYEGDGSVVNVIEGYPRLPLVAVSGIDTTVKLFSPVSGHSAFSRMQNADNIIKRNLEATSRRVDLSSLYTQYRLLLRQATRHRDGAGEGGEGEEGEGDEEPTCTFQ